MSIKRLINYRSSKKCQVATRFIKIRKKRKNLCMKRNKLITKIRSFINTEETNKMEKQIEEIKKSKDDSIRIF